MPGAIQRELQELHSRHLGTDSGTLPDYIPELAKADPTWFGIALCTVDGSCYEAGDSRRPFTIQSISKPFSFALALADNGSDGLLERVGVEPSGDSFNSIVLDHADRPHNPMVNAGAITVVSAVAGSSPTERFGRILEVMGAFAGRDLDVDLAVYESELETGHRNRAIAHLLRTAGVLEGEVDEVLDVYFRQCSVLVTAADLAVMMATLANGGVNPLTGRRAADRDVVGDVLSVMYTAGMYDYSGEWAYRVGLPAKSGVSGGVGALIPDQAGIASFSPLVDERGNSIRGVAVCEEMSSRLGFHLFRNRAESLPPIRAIGSGFDRRSVRVRPLGESRLLDEHGDRIVIIEAQGVWSFVACERLLSVIEDADPAYLVLDTSAMASIDAPAVRLVRTVIESHVGGGAWFVLAGPAPSQFEMPEAPAFPSADEALEWCEDRLLSGLGVPVVPAALALEDTDLTRGLTSEETAEVMGHGIVRSVEAGVPVMAAGELADSLFLVLHGHLTARVSGRRIAAFGPGSMVGEMGFLDGGRRSATVVADEPSILVEFADLEGLEPELGRRLTANIARVLAQRLAVANRMIAETPVVGADRRRGAGVAQLPAEVPDVLGKVS